MFKVNPEVINNQAEVFNNQILQITGERRFASIHVATIKNAYTMMVTQHNATAEKLRMLLSDINIYAGKIVQELSSAKTRLQELKDTDASNKAAYDDLVYNTHPYTKGEGAKKSEDLKIAEQKKSESTNAISPAQSALDTAQRNIDATNTLITQVIEEIAKTAKDISRAYKIYGQMNEYEKQELPFLLWSIRAGVLAQKVKIFSGNVNSIDAGKILNSNLPTVNWINSREGISLINFLNSKDPKIAGLKQKGEADTWAAEELQLKNVKDSSGKSVFQVNKDDHYRIDQYDPQTPEVVKLPDGTVAPVAPPAIPTEPATSANNTDNKIPSSVIPDGATGTPLAESFEHTTDYIHSGFAIGGAGGAIIGGAAGLVVDTAEGVYDAAGGAVEIVTDAAKGVGGLISDGYESLKDGIADWYSLL